MTDIRSLLGTHTAGKPVHGSQAYAVTPERFAETADRLAGEGSLRLALLYGTDDRSTDGSFGMHAVFGDDKSHAWVLLSTALSGDDPRYPSLTRTLMAAHWYERYARDMFGIEPEGHPDLRRLVHHENIPLGTHPLRKDFAWNKKLPHADVPYPLHHVQGEGVYEIPVGPIHAGVIEPGHFRINAAGERMITVEGKLFFTHKGVEKLLEGKDCAAALPFVERVSGDMAASHALAWCQAVESIAGTNVPKLARQLRTIVCELERLGMHMHDCANILGNGIGYSIAGAHGFRIKEQIVRLSQRLLGNRFWRGFVLPGGVLRAFAREEEADILHTVTGAHRDMQDLLDMAFSADGVRERLETTGVLSLDAARAYGALGPAARGSGIACDVRVDHPYAAYLECSFPVVTETEGDVFARVMVRRGEMHASQRIIRQLLQQQKHSEQVRVECKPVTGAAIGAVESWRGEVLTVVHFKNGVIDRCVIRDPSFCNWPLFGEICPGNIVPDLPLCNKSLDLSYSGTDM